MSGYDGAMTTDAPEYPAANKRATPARCALVLLVISGCQSKSPLEGKSVAEWEAQLRTGDALAQAQAGLGLSKLGPGAAPAVPALIEALKSPDTLVRQNAAVALTAIGPDSRTAVAPLMASLADAEWGVRRQAALALGAIGPEAKESAAALKIAAADKNSLVQKAAKEALKKVGG